MTRGGVHSYPNLLQIWVRKTVAEGNPKGDQVKSSCCNRRGVPFLAIQIVRNGPSGLSLSMAEDGGRLTMSMAELAGPVGSHSIKQLFTMHPDVCFK